VEQFKEPVGITPEVFLKAHRGMLVLLCKQLLQYHPVLLMQLLLVAAVLVEIVTQMVQVLKVVMVVVVFCL
jgi:hypothetical protein